MSWLADKIAKLRGQQSAKPAKAGNDFADRGSIPDDPANGKPLDGLSLPASAQKYEVGNKSDIVSELNKVEFKRGAFRLDMKSNDMNGLMTQLSDNFPNVFFTQDNQGRIKVNSKEGIGLEEVKKTVAEMCEGYQKKDIDLDKLIAKDSKKQTEKIDVSSTLSKPEINSPTTGNIELNNFRVSASLRESKIYMSFKDNGVSLNDQQKRDLVGKLNQYAQKYAEKSQGKANIEFGVNKKGAIFMEMKDHATVKSTEGQVYLMSAVMKVIAKDFNKSDSNKNFAGDFTKKVNQAKGKVNYHNVKMNKKDGTMQTHKNGQKTALNESQVKNIEKKLNEKYGQKNNATYSIQKSADGKSSELLINGKKRSEVGEDKSAKALFKKADQYLEKKGSHQKRDLQSKSSVSIKMK